MECCGKALCLLLGTETKGISHWQQVLCALEMVPLSQSPEKNDPRLEFERGWLELRPHCSLYSLST